jgi:hypothetical protein
MNINAFKNILARRGGLAKQNRFNIIIALPVSLASDQGRDLSLLCESTMIPGKQITTVEYALYGHSTKIPTNFIQEDVTCVFNITNDYYVKTVFDRWQNKVIDTKTYLLNYDKEYRLDIIIQQLDEKDKVIFETKLLGAYPISVQQIMLDNGADGATQKLSVTFSYLNYKISYK